MKLVVTGGAGYIGSVVAAQLLAAGHEVLVLDDLSRGHRAAVPAGATLAEVDILERDQLHDTLATVKPDGVLHFAALSLVGESVQHPDRYWRTNVCGTRNLLDAMREAECKRLVFSSSAATYGIPDTVPIPETAPANPVNPYGQTKLAVDRMIGDECLAYDLAAVSLRYFNVAGASGGLGEDHDPETHLIPNVLKAAMGSIPAVEIFGTDYPTPDGTAVRDYIHVEDLAEAHALSLDAAESTVHRILNCGNGDGFSVREIVTRAKEVTGIDIPVKEGPRRPGDPPALVASSDRVREQLGWEPTRDVAAMIEDAWTWSQAHPDGYGGAP